MTKHAIPDAVLAQHVAVLGKTGSGKTSTEKLAVEQVVAEGFRVCVLDTVKSDWWGITSSADGKRAGLPFKILGGPHGHVPLHSGAGKAIGQLVGAGKLPLSIIDMADFEAGGIQRFFVDFAQALLKAPKGVLYLVIEEAHEVAPKERAGFGAENLAIHYAKKLATAGRSKGFRLIVATQRVQSLHNAVLGSCDTLITHRLTTPADQEPVVKWLKANVSKEQAAEVAAELSSLPTGEGYICSGEAKIFARLAFPKFKTYDNAATPTGDEEAVDVKTAAVDADELRAIIGQAVIEAEANDPRALRAQLARVTAENTRLANAAPAPAAAIDTKEIERLAYDRGRAEGHARALAEVGKNMVQIAAHASRVGTAISAAADLAMKLHDAIDTFAPAPLTYKSSAPAPVPAKRPAQAAAPRQVPAPAVSFNGNGNGDGGAGGEATALSKPQLAVLSALVWWLRLGHDAPTRKQVAAVCGWAPTGSNIRDRTSELVRLGMIRKPTNETVTLTELGTAAAPEPDIQGGVAQNLRTVLSDPQRKVFDALPKDGAPIDRDALAEALGWQPGGSNIRDRLSELSRLAIVDRVPPRDVKLQEWVVQ